MIGDLFNAFPSDWDRSQWERIAAILRPMNEAPPLPRTGRDLVLGMATNYTVGEIAPFILSLRQTGYAGDVVLWVAELEEAAERLLQACDVELQYNWEPAFLPFDSILARFFGYFGFLRSMASNGRHADRVFLTDVRDVVFQADPFASVPPGELIVYLEDGSKTLDTCGWCSRWLREGFGDAALQALRGRRISCAGTVFGTWNGILRYLLLMQMTAFECALEGRHRWGIDQGIHNMMLYHGRLDPVTVAENGEHVFTMGYVPGRHIHVSADQKVTDESGRVYPILHQYDRHPAMVEMIQAVYVGSASVIAAPAGRADE